MTEPQIQPFQPPSRNPAALVALAQLNMGRVLRPLVNLFTGIAFYFYVRQFLSSSFVLRYDPDIAYVTLLTAYAGHREIRRWVQDPEVIQERARRGELFVVFWWAFYAVTLTAANHVVSYSVPNGLLSLCIQVTTIFFGTLTSQQLYKRRRGRLEEAPVDGPTLEYQMLEQIRQAKEPVRPAVLEEQLDVSRSTVYRLTRRLLAADKIEWTGRNENDPEGGFRAK
jgi:hypothetical protein